MKCWLLIPHWYRIWTWAENCLLEILWLLPDTKWMQSIWVEMSLYIFCPIQNARLIETLYIGCTPLFTNGDLWVLPSRKGPCHWWTFMDIHDVKMQHFTETLYKPIILAMEICELWWPNFDMVVHEISLPKWLDYKGLLMKCCVLTSWKSMAVHERS